MQPIGADRDLQLTRTVSLVPTEHDLIGLSTEAMARLLIDLAHSSPALAAQLRRRLEALPLPSPRGCGAVGDDLSSRLVGESAAMRRVRKEIRQYAARRAAVTGERAEIGPADFSAMDRRRRRTDDANRGLEQEPGSAGPAPMRTARAAP